MANPETSHRIDVQLADEAVALLGVRNRAAAVRRAALMAIVAMNEVVSAHEPCVEGGGARQVPDAQGPPAQGWRSRAACHDQGFVQGGNRHLPEAGTGEPAPGCRDSPGIHAGII